MRSQQNNAVVKNMLIKSWWQNIYAPIQVIKHFECGEPEIDFNKMNTKLSN